MCTLALAFQYLKDIIADWFEKNNNFFIQHVNFVSNKKSIVQGFLHFF